MLRSLRVLSLAGLVWWLCPQTVLAGGFELGANGTEALGRGGAFVAKADSPLALEYNVAGFAQQRGTRLLVDNHLFFSRYAFQRSGGSFPLVRDQGPSPFYAPWVGISTDFGYFKRWTFALGGFGPASVGRRNYGLYAPMEGDPRSPAPTRYDVVATDLLIIQPSLAVAVRAHPMLDIGLLGQLVVSSFNLSSATYAAQSLPTFPKSAPCTQRSEAPDCDTLTRVQVHSVNNFALGLGLLFHPVPGLHIGASMRTAVNLGLRRIQAMGTVSASEPSSLEGLGLGTDRMDAQFEAALPWIARGGVRYAFSKQGRELADIELNFVYETWSQSQGSDNALTLLSPPALINKGEPLTIRLPHNYRDTFSVRLGGSVSQPLSQQALLALRAGFLFDSSASQDADLRLDFDTLAKLGGTVGVGVTVRGLTLNVAYAYLYSMPRTVTDGNLRPTDGLTGEPLRISGELVPAVNNGDYSGQNHIVSLGLAVRFDQLLRGR